MSINNKLCIFAITAASVFVSISTHAVPDKQTTIEKQNQKEKEQKRLREKRAELESLMLLGAEKEKMDCLTYPFC